ncbi:hypothetical protein ACRRTK_020150 [Alexandromys fortis]
MADPWQECMDYAVTLARRAGEMIREALQNEVNVMFKSSPADLVTVTDQNIEKMLLSSIKEKYPSHSFIGEESVAAGEKTVFTDKPTWIIDPIDGTTNFVHRFPFVAVSIGFVVNKQVALNTGDQPCVVPGVFLSLNGTVHCGLLYLASPVPQRIWQ